MCDSVALNYHFQHIFIDVSAQSFSQLNKYSAAGLVSLLWQVDSSLVLKV